MKTLMTPDATQTAILPHLQRTEELLAKAAESSSGRAQQAEVIALPDLGLPHNVRRIHGGFYTGAYYSWTSDVPMVPVDATVNVCGVSLYRTDLDVGSDEEFAERLRSARDILEEKTPYSWNWNRGNHFISLTEVREGTSDLEAGRYLVLHASAAEFKSQYNGLYPAAGNWYSSRIQTVWGEDGRYLRYLSGSTAESFTQTATMLEGYHRQRQRICAELIAGPSGLAEEIISVPHYGMPDPTSVAIGCQWLSAEDPRYLLLTRPEAPLYFVRARAGAQNVVQTSRGERMLTPHGLGVRATSSPEIRYDHDALVVNGKSHSLGESLASDPELRIRDYDGPSTIARALTECPGDTTAVLHQLFSHYRTKEEARDV